MNKQAHILLNEHEQAGVSRLIENGIYESTQAILSAGLQMVLEENKINIHNPTITTNSEEVKAIIAGDRERFRGEIEELTKLERGYLVFMYVRQYKNLITLEAACYCLDISLTYYRGLKKIFLQQWEQRYLKMLVEFANDSRMMSDAEFKEEFPFEDRKALIDTEIQKELLKQHTKQSKHRNAPST